jgi:seryl-tRNA synthetase
VLHLTKERKMLDIKLIREQAQVVKEALQKRQMEINIVDQVIAIDAQRRKLLVEVETLKAERNDVSKEISQSKIPKERETKITLMREVGERISGLDEKVNLVDEELNKLIAVIPNIPDADVPIGKDDTQNPVIKTVGEKPNFDFPPQPHWDLGTKLGIINFEQGVKITGSRFYVLSGAGARLQRALIAWMLDLHSRQGYLEKYPPFMVKGDTLFASGQLPKFVDNLYKDHEEDLWMVPTAEVPLTGIHMGDVLDGNKLPLHYTAYTACFRREKMSAGRDVRGIKRGHQFDKVEMYTYCRPEDSARELEKMVADAAQTCADLGLPYRIVQQCTGDLGFNGKKAFDVEVWAAGCAEWLEVSSISNVGDFQARRANIKFKDADGKKDFVHTLNGSGLGLPRTLIAVLENNQQKDGTILIPDVLKPWMGGITRIGPEA